MLVVGLGFTAAVLDGGLVLMCVCQSSLEVQRAALQTCFPGRDLGILTNI